MTHGEQIELAPEYRIPRLIIGGWQSASGHSPGGGDRQTLFAAWNQLVEAVTAVTGPARADAAVLHVWSSVHGLSMLKLAQRLPPDILLHNVEEQKLRMMMAGITAE